MNALAPTLATQPANALLPRDLPEAWRMAEMMAKARLLPAAVQNPADAFLVINQAMRWGMDPFAVAQEVSVVSGKLMHSGKIVAAAIQSSGILEGRLRYDYSGEGAGRAVTVSGKLRGEAEAVSITLRLADAKTENKMWVKQPDQQLAYAGSRVWARRYAPEVMLGVYAPEEMEDAPPPAAPLPAARGPVMEGAPAEAAVFTVIRPDGDVWTTTSADKWAAACRRALAKVAPDGAAALIRWRDAMEAHIAAVPLPHGEEVRAALETALDDAAERGAIQADGAP